MNAQELYAGGFITLKEFIKALALKEQGAPYLGEFMEALNRRARFGEPKAQQDLRQPKTKRRVTKNEQSIKQQL
jgi:hypothetical protein